MKQNYSKNTRLRFTLRAERTRESQTPQGVYFCLFSASATFCSPAYIIPPAIHAPTIIATPVNKVATSIVISPPPSNYVMFFVFFAAAFDA
jgi:hypothetical protein